MGGGSFEQLWSFNSNVVDHLSELSHKGVLKL